MRSFLSISILSILFKSLYLHATPVCHTHLLKQALRNTSVQLQKTLLRTGATYDFLVIGAGPVSATFALSLKKTNPQLRVLVLESSSFFSNVFGKHRDFYRLTTCSQPNDEQNYFPNTNLQPHLFRTQEELTKSPFPFPKTIEKTIIHALFASNSDILLSNKIVEVETDPKTNFYTVSLSSGVQLHAKNVVFATGQGSINLKSFDFETQHLIQACLESKTSPIRSFDQSIEQALSDRQNNMRPLDRYANKEVLVVGRGIASFNFVEFLLGLAPEELYLKQHPNLPKAIFWVGVDPSSIKKNLTDPLLAQRHQRLLNFCKNENQKPLITGTSQTLTHIELSDRDRLLVRECGKTISADLAVLATGYENHLHRMLQSLFKTPKIRLVPIIDPETGSIVGKRVFLENSKPQNLYVVGTAAGKDQVFKEELEHSEIKNPFALFHILPKAAFLGNQLAKKIKPFDFSNPNLNFKNTVVNWWFQNKVGVSKSETPEIIFLAGLPGSGKSTWVRKYLAQGKLNEENTILVNPDLIKEMLPAAPKNTAGQFHELSTSLQIPIVQKGLESRLNLVIDGTFRNRAFFEKLLKKIRSQFPEYRIRVVHIICNPNVAKKRIEERFQKTGRYVPPQDLYKLDALIRNNIIELRSLVDVVSVYSGA